MVAGLWFHQLGAGSQSGGQWAALGTRAGEAPMELGWGAGLGATGATWDPPLPGHAQGPCPNSQQDCQRGPVQTLPSQAPSWEAHQESPRVPRTPTSVGHELLSPLLSLHPTQAGGASVAPGEGTASPLGLRFLRLLPSPTVDQASTGLPCHPVPPSPHFGGHTRPLPPTPLPARPSVGGLWHSSVLDLGGSLSEP